jgi:hypothetical protein
LQEARRKDEIAAQMGLIAKLQELSYYKILLNKNVMKKGAY